MNIRTVAATLVIFLLVVSTALFFKGGFSDRVSFVLSSSAKQTSVGEAFQVSVYVTGVDAKDITAFDVRFLYDEDIFVLDSVSKGTFFSEYLPMKNGTDSTRFAFSFDPSSYKDSSQYSSPQEPLLIATFSSKKTRSQPAAITLTEDSTVYLKEKGAMSIKSKPFYMRVR